MTPERWEGPQSWGTEAGALGCMRRKRGVWMKGSPCDRVAEAPMSRVPLGDKQSPRVITLGV